MGQAYDVKSHTTSLLESFEILDVFFPQVGKSCSLNHQIWMSDIGISPVSPDSVGNIYPFVKVSGYMDKQIYFGWIDAVSLRSCGDYLSDPVVIDWLDFILQSSKIEDIPVAR